MGFDFSSMNQMGGQFDRVLSTLPYPIEKSDLLQLARHAGANEQMVSAMQKMLPEKTFNSAQDVKNLMGNIDKSNQTKM